MQTARGHFSALCSQYDNFGPSFSTDFPKDSVSCLPHRLKELGYRTLFIQGGELKFDNQAESMKTIGFDELIGLREFPGKYAGDESGWGKNDETIFDYSLELIEKTKEPLFVTIVTITNHHPFMVPRKNFEIFSTDTIEDRFFNSIYYSDWALGRFVDGLKTRGLLENTVLLITADHPQPMKEHKSNIMEVSYAYEENFRIPLLIHAPGYLAPAADNFVGSHIDIMPTVLGMLGITRQKETVRGENLLDPAACRYALMLQPFGERFSAVRLGTGKYLYNWQRKTGMLFDLALDPREESPAVNLDEKARSLHNFMVNTIFSSNRAMKENRLAPASR